MTEEMPRNSESQMLSQLVKWIRKNIPKLKVLFTWADGMVGKVGYVYQASNFIYAGYSGGEMYMKDGVKIHVRQMKSFLVPEGQKDNRITVRPTVEQMKKHNILHFKGMNLANKKSGLNSPLHANIPYWGQYSTFPQGLQGVFGRKTVEMSIFQKNEMRRSQQITKTIPPNGWDGLEMSVAGLESLQVLDKLLGHTAGETAVADLPGVGLSQQLLFGHVDAVALGQKQNDLPELLL